MFDLTFSFIYERSETCSDAVCIGFERKETDPFYQFSDPAKFSGTQHSTLVTDLEKIKKKSFPIFPIWLIMIIDAVSYRETFSLANQLICKCNLLSGMNLIEPFS